jgi:hypothetical protein
MMSNALTRERFVRKAANDVEMDVRDGLPRDFSDIPANIVALWLGFIQVAFSNLQESEGVRPFL